MSIRDNIRARTTHRVVMLGFPDAQILDITGPLEVFCRTNRWIADNLGTTNPAYAVEIVAERPGPLRLSGGLELVAAHGFEEVDRADTLLIPGGLGHAAAAEDPALLHWLTGAAARSGRVGSICNGALILGACGLLVGRRATTHWAYCDKLAEAVPDCQVMPDAVYVRDGNIYTSAGVTSGMDMALALVEDDWGRAVALRVAQELVMYLVRPGGQSQFSRHLKAQIREGRFGNLDLFIVEHLHEALPIERLAGVAGISPRQFTRSFTQEFRCSPGAYVAQLRVEKARSSLEEATDHSLKDLARRFGFGSEQNLRRTFKRTIGITPEDYRSRFGPRAGRE